MIHIYFGTIAACVIIMGIVFGENNSKDDNHNSEYEVFYYNNEKYYKRSDGVIFKV